MKPLIMVSFILLLISSMGILLVFLLYPLSLRFVYLIKRKDAVINKDLRPFVSLLIVVRNAEDLIEEKLRNSLELNYPQEKYEVIVFSDGSTDGTERKVELFKDKRLQFFSSNLHRGKSSAMNDAIGSCSGDIVVFSDVDAVLNPNALLKLVRHYADPDIGGVCGQRVIHRDETQLKDAQKGYIMFDSSIKAMESRVGTITSNDGKIYSIRRELYRPIKKAVTDDLFVSLSVIRHGFRFVFEPEAKAYIRIPSRSTSHEIIRRRRIVTGSLKGIWVMKEVLNPFKYGFFSIGLTINKIVRRLLPVCLILFLLSSLFLSLYHPLFRGILVVQIVFYLLAVLYPVFFRHISNPKTAGKFSSLAYYFCLGNYGTLLGLIDFVMGKEIVKWEPIKTDDPEL